MQAAYPSVRKTDSKSDKEGRNPAKQEKFQLRAESHLSLPDAANFLRSGFVAPSHPARSGSIAERKNAQCHNEAREHVRVCLSVSAGFQNPIYLFSAIKVFELQQPLR